QREPRRAVGADHEGGADRRPVGVEERQARCPAGPDRQRGSWLATGIAEGQARRVVRFPPEPRPGPAARGPEGGALRPARAGGGGGAWRGRGGWGGGGGGGAWPSGGSAAIASQEPSATRRHRRLSRSSRSSRAVIGSGAESGIATSLGRATRRDATGSLARPL